MLPVRAQKRYMAIAVIQTALGMLDLAGVVLISGVTALALRGNNSQPPGHLVQIILNTFSISHLKYQSQVAILASFAVFLLVTKTTVTIFYNRKLLLFLANQTTELSMSLLSKYLDHRIGKKTDKTPHQVQYIITTGTNVMVVGLLGTAVFFIADFFLLVILLTAVMFVDPLTAISSTILFGLLAFFVHKSTHDKAKKVGDDIARYSVETGEQVFEILQAFNDIYLRNGLTAYSSRIRKSRGEFANAIADQNFLPTISKYVFEIAVTIGGIGIAALQFGLHDSAHAVAGLALFLAAGSRVGPAIMRMQQGVLQINSSVSSGRHTLDLMRQLRDKLELKSEISPIFRPVDEEHPDISMENVQYKYEPSEEYELHVPQLDIPFGTSVGIVGPSGGGKTTLVNLLMGLAKPSKGSVTIAGISPNDFIARNMGKIAYVPQNIYLTNGDIYANLVFAIPNPVEDLHKAMEALDFANFKLPGTSKSDLLRKNVGTAGNDLSGGEIQRLALARAMFTDPKILILDEATSALDGGTEERIINQISSLKGKMTIVLIAHRLSTLANVDQVVYVQSGKVLAVGTITEVRNAVPEFDSQATRMGL